MKQKRRSRYLAEYVVFRVLVCIIDMLPYRASVSLARGMAFVVHRLLPKKMNRWHVSAENIRTAFGDHLSDCQVDRIIHGMWVHLFRMITEIVQLPRKLRLHNCTDFMTFRNRDVSVRAMCSGRPVMVLSGHFGNWEMATATFGYYGFPTGVVARDLDNPYLHDWFKRFRQRTGHVLISKKGGSDMMVDAMERGAQLALLCDQDAGSRGLFVPFFGKPASTFKSIALLAIQYRALICVGYARRLPDDFENYRWARYEQGCAVMIDPLEYEGANAIQEITRDYTAALEEIVRLSPEQYFWVHRRWKSKPKVRKKKQADKLAA